MMTEFLADLPWVFSVFRGRGDPAFMFAFALNLGVMQLLVWVMARHTADIELWRTMAGVLVVATIMLVGSGTRDLTGLAGAGVVAILAGWVVHGHVFDLERWQRVVMAVSGPIVAILSYASGRWLEAVLFQSGRLLE